MANIDDEVVRNIEETQKFKKLADFCHDESKLPENALSESKNVSADLSKSKSSPSLADSNDNATIRSSSTHHYQYIEYPLAEIQQQPSSTQQNAMPQVPRQQQQQKQQLQCYQHHCHHQKSCCNSLHCTQHTHADINMPFANIPMCCQSHMPIFPVPTPSVIDRSSFPQYQPDGRLAVSAIVHRQSGANSKTSENSLGSLVDLAGCNKTDSDNTLQTQSQQSLLSHSYQALQSIPSLAPDGKVLNILDSSTSKLNIGTCHCDLECVCDAKTSRADEMPVATESRWKRKQKKNRLSGHNVDAIKNANDLTIMGADEITVSESDNNGSMKRQGKRKNRNAIKCASYGNKKLNTCCKFYEDAINARCQSHQFQGVPNYHRQQQQHQQHQLQLQLHQYHYAANHDQLSCHQDGFLACETNYSECSCLKDQSDVYADGDVVVDDEELAPATQRLNCANHIDCRKSHYKYKLRNDNNNHNNMENMETETNDSEDAYEVENVGSTPPLPPRPQPHVRSHQMATSLSGHRSTSSTVGVKKYVIWCLICGGFSCLLGILFLGVYFLLHSYTITVGNFETVPTFVPATLLILTGLCIMSLARRKNRYSYLIKLSGACGLISALTCALVTVTTTVLHMSRLQALRECEYAQKTRTCTCYSDMIESQVDRVDKEGVRLVFDSLSDCGVVHGSLYSCLRAIFGLSVAGVLIAVFSCMLVYQLLSHERKKMYWEQLELRCRSLYTSQQGPPPHSLNLHAGGRVGAPSICRCCEQYHAHRQLQTATATYPWDENGEPRFWTGQPPGNFYSPNPGGDENLHATMPSACRSGGSSTNSRGRSITAGWSWPRMPWQSRSSPDPNSRFRSGAPSSPDSQYGFSSTAAPIASENTLAEEQAAAAAAAAAVAAAHAQAHAYNAVANNLPYGVWGPPPPYSDPNSPARRNYYQYMQPPNTTCNPLNITSNANMSNEQRQPPQLTLNAVAASANEQHMACLSHRPAFFDGQTALSGSAGVVNVADCCTQTANMRGSLKRTANNYKTKGGDMLSDSDGGAGRDRFSNTLPTRKAKKRMDAIAGVKSIGPNTQNHAAHRVNVQQIFPNSSNCQNTNDCIEQTLNANLSTANLISHSNANANDSQDNSNAKNNNNNGNIADNANATDDLLTTTTTTTTTMTVLVSNANRIEAMLPAAHQHQKRNGSGIENTAYQNNGDCETQTAATTNQANHSDNIPQEDPTESEVYFADVSSCCNMSLKNDNYYGDNSDSGHQIMGSSGLLEGNSNNKGNGNSLITNSNKAVNTNSSNNNNNISTNGNSNNNDNNNFNRPNDINSNSSNSGSNNNNGNSSNHHSHHHHRHHHAHVHGVQPVQPSRSNKQHQQQQQQHHHRHHHMHQHSNCSQHSTTSSNATNPRNNNEDFQQQQYQTPQQQYYGVRENSHSSRLQFGQSMKPVAKNHGDVTNNSSRCPAESETQSSEFTNLNSTTPLDHRLIKMRFSPADRQNANTISSINNSSNNNASNKIGGRESNFVASLPFSSESLEAHRRSTKNIHDLMLVSEAHYEVIDEGLGVGLNTNTQLTMSSPGLRPRHHIDSVLAQQQQQPQQRANNFGTCSNSSSIRSNKSRERLDMMWTGSDAACVNGSDRQRL